jgi:hypothetical protein
MFDVVKQEMDSTKLFAIFPNAATQFSVHRITKHVCFRKNIPRPPETPAAAGSTKKAKAPKSSSLEGKSSCSKMLHFVVHCFFVYLYSSILCLLDLLS